MADIRLMILVLLAFVLPLAQAETLTGQVVRVTDGDTIVILSDGNAQHKIRLTGIDAPERKQAFGNKSKEHLSEQVVGRPVIVEYSERDRYERILGKVFLDNEDMNLEQIRAGLAWHYKKHQNEQTPTDRDLYSKAEIEARESRRGLWHEPKPVTPWKYRKSRRK